MWHSAQNQSHQLQFCILYVQTERSMKTRITENKRAVSMFDHDSKISCHVHEYNHKMDFRTVRVVGQEVNFHERPFLVAWMSIKDPQSGNDHIVIPEVYESSLWHAQKSRATFSWNFTRNFPQRAFNVLCFESRVLTLAFQLMKAQAPAETCWTKHQKIVSAKPLSYNGVKSLKLVLLSWAIWASQDWLSFNPPEIENWLLSLYPHLIVVRWTKLFWIDVLRQKI